MTLPANSVAFDADAANLAIVWGLGLTEFFDLRAPSSAERGSAWVWRIYDPTAGEYLDGVLDATIIDAFQRFARQATVVLFDPDGTRAADYPRNAPLQIYCAKDDDTTPTLRWGGYVVNPVTADATLTLELVSFDFWLRSRRVYKSYTDETKSAILEDLIEDLTPLTYDSDLVTVSNDATMTREFKGEYLDAVIAEIAAASGNEEWGATDDQTFFFRPSHLERSPRDFVEGEWSTADFDEDGRMEVNKVTVYWGSGGSTGAVAIQNLTNQLALQAALGTARPVVIESVKTYPEIASAAAAKVQAQKILSDREAVQTGELATWQALDVSPGDVARVEVEDQQIDADFRVAQIEYRYATGETTITLAENTGGVVDALVELCDEVSRLDARDADTTATVRECLAFTETIGVEYTLAVYTRTVPATTFTLGSARGGIGGPGVGGTIGSIGRGARTQVI